MNDAHESKVVYLRLDDIIPNRFQPREVFDEAGLQELADSIKEHGVIQPIIVRKLGDKYELIAGERRTKATALAGLTTIPAIIRDMDDQESAKVSLLENLQRKNLSAIEEARTYKRILELDNMTQEDLARTIGRSQPMIANKLRLLSLPEEIQEALMKNQLSERHARSLLTLKNKRDQLIFLDRIKKERLTVRELDAELKKFKENPSEFENLPEFENIKDDEKNERNFMNNNRGNFGGMGLNDYHSGISNNMFNNIPTNFNNMNDVNEANNNQFNYSNFDESSNNDTNQTNDYMNDMNQNNNTFNENQNGSLGPMFDNYNNEPENYQTDNYNNSNLFVSHIREDNLPKVDNQFLPNFDNFNQNNFNESDDNDENGSREALNNFNQNNNFYDMNKQNQFQSNFDMNNDFNSINNLDNSTNEYNYNEFNNNINNGYQNDANQSPDLGNYNQNNMMNSSFNMNNGMNFTNEFSMNNNFDNGFNNNVNPNSNFNPYMNNNFNMNNGYTNDIPNNNYFMNDLNNNNYMNNQNNMMNNSFNMNNGINQNINPMNNGLGMNNNYNPNGNIGPTYNNSSFTDYNGNFGMNQNMYQQNQGGMFAQPLNIIDVPRNNPVETPVNIESNDSINDNSTFEQDNNNQEIFTSPTPIAQDDKEKQNEIETSVEETVENQVENKEEIKPTEADVEVIGDTDVIEEKNDTLVQSNENTDTKNDYISLDPVYTINSTMDAVMELKKTTDRIKQNHIDIETEEIDFDDVYQITIKIKKTDTI